MSRQWLRARSHISWLIAALCVGCVSGVIVAPDLPVTLASVAWLLTGIALAAYGIWLGRRYAVIVMILAGCLIGAWRGGNELLGLRPYDNIQKITVVVTGTVSDDIDKGKQGETVIRLKDAMIDGHSLPGTMWISLTDGRAKTIERSDRLTVKGKIGPGFASFAAVMYRAQLVRVQRPIPGDVALHIRDGFADAVRRVTPEPQASLGIGFLVGQRRSLPDELGKALQIAGLMHIVVASGYNLTILVRLARRLFARYSKYLAFIMSAGLMGGFIAITGASPSMTRAGIVGGLSLLAWYYGRRFHPLVLLPVAAAVTLLMTPQYGWGDLGWQLSFAAFAGVMILAPLLHRYFYGETQPGTIRQIAGESIAAFIVTLPILVVAFGQVSNVAIIANLLIGPLVPVAMLLTFIAGIGAMIIPALGVYIALPAEGVLTYMTTTAQYLAGLSWAQMSLQLDWRFAAVYYGVLIAACVYMARVTGWTGRETSIVE